MMMDFAAQIYRKMTHSSETVASTRSAAGVSSSLHSARYSSVHMGLRAQRYDQVIIALTSAKLIYGKDFEDLIQRDSRLFAVDKLRRRWHEGLAP